MRAFLAGLLLGLVPYGLHRLDQRLKVPYEEMGPIATWWWDRKYRARLWWRNHNLPTLDSVGGWLVGHWPLRPVLARRRFRVTYESHCIYGGPPNGWTPYSVGESWSWTLRGAEWKRRHRPVGYRMATGLGSGMLVTLVDERTPDGYVPVGIDPHAKKEAAA